MTLRPIEEVVENLYAKHHNIGDERYGYVKHHNTMLHRICQDVEELIAARDAEWDERVRELKEAFIEILENNREETLFDDADANEIAHAAIDDFIVAVKDELATLPPTIEAPTNRLADEPPTP